MMVDELARTMTDRRRRNPTTSTITDT